MRHTDTRNVTFRRRNLLAGGMFLVGAAALSTATPALSREPSAACRAWCLQHCDNRCRGARRPACGPDS